MFDSFNLEIALLYGLSKTHATGRNLPLKFHLWFAVTLESLDTQSAKHSCLMPLEG